MAANVHSYTLSRYMSRPENREKLGKKCRAFYRGSYLLKYMCKGLVKQLCYYHMLHGRRHGNLKLENIVYQTCFYSRPDFINPNPDANEGSIAKDFEDMAYIISDLTKNLSIADAELVVFLDDLKTINVGGGALIRNHYFLKSPKEKKNFIEDVWNANVFSNSQYYVDSGTRIFEVKGIFQLKQVVGRKYPHKVYDREEDTATLRYNLKKLRNFFEHGHEKVEKYTDDDMEQILFEACPNFWTILYDRLRNMGILMNYFPREEITLQVGAGHMEEP